MDDVERLAKLADGMEALKDLLSKKDTTEEALYKFLGIVHKEDDANVDD